MKLLRRLLHNQPVVPETIAADGLASYGAALDQLNLRHLNGLGQLRENNRRGNSDLPTRQGDRQHKRFKSKASAQRFLTTAAINKNISGQHHPTSSPAIRRF